MSPCVTILYILMHLIASLSNTRIKSTVPCPSLCQEDQLANFFVIVVCMTTGIARYRGRELQIQGVLTPPLGEARRVLI